MKFVLSCLALAVVTGYVIPGLGFVNSTISDLITVPGGLLASVLWPEGIHSDEAGAGYSPYVSLFGNVAFYWACWLVTGSLLRRLLKSI